MCLKILEFNAANDLAGIFQAALILLLYQRYSKKSYLLIKNVSPIFVPVLLQNGFLCTRIKLTGVKVGKLEK